MLIAKLLDNLETKNYNTFKKGVCFLKDFMNTKFNVYNVIPYAAYMNDKRSTPVFNRSNYCIAIIEGGHGRTVFKNGAVNKGGYGDIFFTPKNSSYHIEVEKPFNSLNIGFSLMEEVELKPFVFNAENGPKLLERFKTALNVWNAKKPGYEEKVLSEFYNIIHTMKKHFFADYLPNEKYSVVKPAIEYIHANYLLKNITVEEISSLCKITPQYFRKIFNNLYGTSPSQYITNLRITQAKQLIDSGAYSITEISDMLGFSEPSQFSRKFKSETGISPKEYKAQKNN